MEQVGKRINDKWEQKEETVSNHRLFIDYDAYYERFSDFLQFIFSTFPHKSLGRGVESWSACDVREINIVRLRVGMSWRTIFVIAPVDNERIQAGISARMRF